jgi:hypothetical protein
VTDKSDIVRLLFYRAIALIIRFLGQMATIIKSDFWGEHAGRAGHGPGEGGRPPLRGAARSSPSFGASEPKHRSEGREESATDSGEGVR